MTTQTTRRGFLAATSATAAGLVVGLSPSGMLAAAPAESALPAEFNPFVRIGADGRVTVVIKHIELGQGTATGLSTLVAEELDAAWEQIDIAFAPADNSRYANLFFMSQGTGGSTAIANSYRQYRAAGAAARALLVQAAAARWGVDPAEVSVSEGTVRAGDRTARFGELVAEAAELTPPRRPRLKDPAEFRLIGAAHLPRKDSASKTDGSAIFASDVKRPNQVVAVILRSPRVGGRLISFDATAAVGIRGFVTAKILRNGVGVAVYGLDTWSAIRARTAVKAEWDESAAETRSSDEMMSDHLRHLDTPEYPATEGTDFAATGRAIEGAAQIVEAEFRFPHLAHAPMEPLTCVIEATETGGVRIHDGAQFPGITQPTIAQLLKLPLEKVEIATVYAGGSFGRRASPTSDYQTEAALAFDALDRSRPVKLVWTREDDLTAGYFRPMAAHRVRVGLDGDGQILGWDHRIATKSILKGSPFEAVLVRNGVDRTSVEGAADPVYRIPGFALGLSDVETPLTALWWRAVGHTHTAYAMESAIDMVAEAAGRDPVDFRLSLLDDGTEDGVRLAGVLRLAAEKAGWGEALPEGRGRGVAVHKSFNSYVAVVVDVSADPDGRVQIEHVTSAVDCGTVVNPDIVRAQIEGGIGFGLGAVMRNEITLTDGVVDQANFPDYEPLRISDIRRIDVHIVPSTAKPTGVGEPGVPPAGPALANAVKAAMGKRVTLLPMTKAGVRFA
ncbi:MAG: molybdopterin cofactor-binding domain-containing protein [Paracoccaceae bacterium]